MNKVWSNNITSNFIKRICVSRHESVRAINENVRKLYLIVFLTVKFIILAVLIAVCNAAERPYPSPPAHPKIHVSLSYQHITSCVRITSLNFDVKLLFLSCRLSDKLLLVSLIMLLCIRFLIAHQLVNLFSDDGYAYAYAKTVPLKDDAARSFQTNIWQLTGI